MSSGTHTNPKYESREVLLAKITFPQQTEKTRPVLVISKFSSISLMPSSLILICLPITSNTNHDPHMIQITNSDMEENQFPKPSQVICDNIFTILKTDIIKKIGKVKPDFYKKITDHLKNQILEI